MFLEREGVRGRARALIPADPKIYTHLPYVIELDDEVVRTRDNGLMISLEVTGIDGITSGSSAVSALRAGFAHLLDTLDERFSFYLHRMMRPAQTQLKPIHGQSFAADIERAWGAELQRRNLQESVLILTVVRRQVAPLAVPIFGKAAAKVWGEDTDRRLEELREVVSILETGLGVKSHRLKISDGKISEIEQLAIRPDSTNSSRSDFPPTGEGMEKMGAPHPIFSQAIPPAERETREELVRDGNYYFAGLQRNDGKGYYPFTDDCIRFENGVDVLLGRPGTPNEGKRQSCKGQFETGVKGIVSRIRDRRFVAVDRERGIAFAFGFFDHEQINWTWQLAELFKVEKGKIRRIEAIFHRAPYGLNSGWSTFEQGMSEEPQSVR